MFSLEELNRRFDAYKDDRISRAEFHDWFEANSYDAHEDAHLRDVCVAIDTAFSEYFFDDISEDALKEELANAVRPFVFWWSEDSDASAIPVALSASPEVKVYFEGGAEAVLDARTFLEAFGFAVEDIADAEAKKPSKKLAASASRPEPLAATA